MRGNGNKGGGRGNKTKQHPHDQSRARRRGQFGFEVGLDPPNYAWDSTGAKDSAELSLVSNSEPEGDSDSESSEDSYPESKEDSETEESAQWQPIITLPPPSYPYKNP